MSDAPVSAFLGQENVTRASCRVSNLNVAWNIILFFGANIIAHALTITIRSGQKAWKTFLVSCGVIFSPFIVRMNYSEAMMDVLDAWRNRWREARTDISWKERLHVAIFGNKDGRWPLQTAIDSGAVAIEVPKDRRAQAEAAHWQVVDMEEGIALFVDGLAVSEETEYRLIPVGAKSESEIQVAPSSSVLKTVVTIAQLLYTSIELYQSYDRDVRMNGLSSPFIVIIPYVVGSFMNLIINIFLVSYPYVVVMRPKSRDGITTTKSEMPEPVPSAPQPEKPSSDHEEVAVPSFPSYDSDKDNGDTSSLSEAFVSRPSDHWSVRSASEELEPEKPTASRPGTLSHTESEPLLHNMASSRAEEGLPLPVTALKTEKAVDVAAADSDLLEFLAWVYETYDLQYVPKVETDRWNGLFLNLGFSSTIVLTVALVLTRCRFSKVVPAVSFVCWIFIDWIAFIGVAIWALADTLIETMYGTDFKSTWRSLLENAMMVACVVSYGGLTIWGIVTTVMLLIPYFSQCS